MHHLAHQRNGVDTSRRLRPLAAVPDLSSSLRFNPPLSPRLLPLSLGDSYLGLLMLSDDPGLSVHKMDVDLFNLHCVGSPYRGRNVVARAIATRCLPICIGVPTRHLDVRHYGFNQSQAGPDSTLVGSTNTHN